MPAEVLADWGTGSIEGAGVNGAESEFVASSVGAGSLVALLADGGRKSLAADAGDAEPVGLGEFSGLVAETVPAANLASYWARFSGSVKQSLAAVNSSNSWAHC